MGFWSNMHHLIFYMFIMNKFIKVGFCVSFTVSSWSVNSPESSTMKMKCQYCIRNKLPYCSFLYDVKHTLIHYQQLVETLVDQCSAVWGALNTLQNETRRLAEFVLSLAEKYIGILLEKISLCKNFLDDNSQERHSNFVAVGQSLLNQYLPISSVKWSNMSQWNYHHIERLWSLHKFWILVNLKQHLSNTFTIELLFSHVKQLPQEYLL